MYSFEIKALLNSENGGGGRGAVSFLLEKSTLILTAYAFI